jgi:hypothetical protein
MTAEATRSGARLHGTVRVSLPAKVAYNPESLKKTIGSFLERVGCPTCFSGANCVFTAERSFVVDEGGVFSQHLTPVASPNPWPWHGATVTASLAGGGQFNIDQVYRAIDAVVATLGGGCRPCHSGFDVAYLSEVEFIGVDANGQAQQYGTQAQLGE